MVRQTLIVNVSQSVNRIILICIPKKYCQYHRNDLTRDGNKIFLYFKNVPEYVNKIIIIYVHTKNNNNTEENDSTRDGKYLRPWLLLYVS